MKSLAFVLSILGAIFTSPAGAWSNHSLPAYRALEAMPEVANADPVIAEPLDAFLKAEEKTLEALLASQEAWAASNLENYPMRPSALAFIAKPERSDKARRLAFLTALRVAPDSKFVLYIQPDARVGAIKGALLPYAAVNTLPEPKNSSQKFVALKAGERVAALSVVASAADEPDYGLDINLWDDSPSAWGKTYGFGTLPFGNPALSFSTQAPFHMAFMHESRVLYLAAPFLKRTFPRLRTYQYSTLAALAFRTGHPYWGWRFTGLALHYLQDLTQPYHSRVAPADSTAKLLWANALAMAGMHSMKDDMIVLLSNRHLALEKYQSELLENDAHAQQDTAIEKALRNMDKDARYPEWSEQYLRDVVSPQAAVAGPQLVRTLVAAMPAEYVSNPAFDFGTKEDTINLVAELAKTDPAPRVKLDAAIAELLANFGAHSRNAVRGILKASNH